MELPFIDWSALAEPAARDGYVVVRGLLPLDKVSAVRARLEAACARHGLWPRPKLTEGSERKLTGNAPPPWPPRWDDPRLVAVQAEVLPGPEVRALGQDARLVESMSAVLGGPALRKGGDVCRVALPDAPERATPPHQDQHYLKSAAPIWIAWIPLVDCPVERGPLAVIAGSHRGGLRPHRGDSLDSLAAEVDSNEQWTSDGFAPGDALLLDALTVHRSLVNRSAEPRLSIDFRFARSLGA